MKTILYLHGFLSSPQSIKAQQTLRFAEQHFPDTKIIVPSIPNTIDIAVPFLERLVEEHFVRPSQPILCIGSSMGGFLSNWIVESNLHRLAGKAVLVNPAVAPYNLMQDFIGEQVNPYSQERFCVDTHHIDVLKQLEPSQIEEPSRYKLLLQTGDEVLDYQLAVQRYQGADMVIESGGDHSFVNYEQHLHDIFQFLTA